MSSGRADPARGTCRPASGAGRRRGGGRALRRGDGRAARQYGLPRHAQDARRRGLRLHRHGVAPVRVRLHRRPGAGLLHERRRLLFVARTGRVRQRGVPRRHGDDGPPAHRPRWLRALRRPTGPCRGARDRRDHGGAYEDGELPACPLRPRPGRGGHARPGGGLREAAPLLVRPLRGGRAKDVPQAGQDGRRYGRAP